jgi:hypothetical protein
MTGECGENRWPHCYKEAEIGAILGVSGELITVDAIDQSGSLFDEIALLIGNRMAS